MEIPGHGIRDTCVGNDARDDFPAKIDEHPATARGARHRHPPAPFALSLSLCLSLSLFPGSFLPPSSSSVLPLSPYLSFFFFFFFY